MMKMEMVDPLTLNSITVGTVVKVLKNDNILVAVDGKNFDLGTEAEHFCMHTKSPYLLPLGFCDKYRTQIKPPPHYRGKFLWPDYLEASCSVGAPEALFEDYVFLNRAKPNLVVGERLEAIDLLNPSLILPATVVSGCTFAIKA